MPEDLDSSTDRRAAPIIWSTLRSDLALRVWFVYLAIELFPYLVPVLRPEQLDRWGETFGDLVFLPVVIGVLLAGLGKLANQRERRFWRYIALAFASWFFVRCLFALVPDDAISGWVAVGFDAIYLAFYLFWFQALTVEAHEPTLDSRDPTASLQSLGGLALVSLLFAYFVVIPAHVNIESYDTWRTSFYFYPVLDGLLAVRFLTLWREAPSPRWRMVYGLLSLNHLLVLMMDALEGLSHLEPFLSLQAPGSRFNVIWSLVFVPLILAARVRHVPFASSGDRPAHTTGTAAALQTASPLLVSAFLLPVVHLGFHVSGTLDESLRDPREVLVLLGLLVLGGLAIVEHALLRRHQASVEREKAEASRDAEEKAAYLSSLVESSPLAIVMLDPDGRTRTCNAAFESLFQYAEAEVIGRRLDELIIPTEQEEEASSLTGRVLAGEVVSRITRRRCKDRSLVDVELHGVPAVSDGQVIGLYALYHDIGERLRLEEQLRLSQRMEGLGRLAGGVAHDFNNLLTAILGFTELARQEVDPDAVIGEHLQKIGDAGERAGALVRQLLAFGRLQVLEPSVLDLNQIVNEFEELLRRTLPEDIRLVKKLHPDLGSIEADRGKVEQVLMNLAVNARDAMLDGGTLTIETVNRTLDDAYVDDHRGSRSGEHVMLAISDTGAGMDSDTSQRIFEPFFTTKEVGKGTGLGLSTVYGIVKQSGGNIWVYSEPDTGTTFKIYFPRVARTPDVQRAPVGRAASGGSETLLVVEDEESVRELTQKTLEGAGYSVLAAQGAEEAMAVCAAHAGPIHLLLTDVMLPDKRGNELAKLVTARRAAVKVLYMSGYTESSVLDHEPLLRAGTFLEKPFSRNALLDRVRAVLDGTAAPHRAASSSGMG